MVREHARVLQELRIGLLLSVLLLYLILVAQFRSFIDPFIILLALAARDHRRSADAVADGHHAECDVADGRRHARRRCDVEQHPDRRIRASPYSAKDGRAARRSSGLPRPAAARSDDSLATIIGLLPMALKLGEGSEAYAPLARALIGGLTVSVICTVFIVPAGFFLAYRRRGPMPV